MATFIKALPDGRYAYGIVRRRGRKDDLIVSGEAQTYAEADAALLKLEGQPA